METKAKKDQSAADAINKATQADVKKQEKEMADEAAKSNENDPLAEDPLGATAQIQDPLADDPVVDDNKPDPDEQSAARAKLEKDRAARKASKRPKSKGESDAEKANALAKKKAANEAAKKLAKKEGGTRAVNKQAKKTAKTAANNYLIGEAQVADGMANKRETEAEDLQRKADDAKAIAKKARSDAENVGKTETTPKDAPMVAVVYKGDDEHHIAKKRASLKATLVNLRDLSNDIKSCSEGLEYWLENVDNVIREVNLV